MCLADKPVKGSGFLCKFFYLPACQPNEFSHISECPGFRNSTTAAALFGSVLMLCREMRWPRKGISSYSSWHFLGLSFAPSPRSRMKTSSKDSKCFSNDS
ncbi:hypothetical protein RRG08_031645 [Elysia crispata]|uniref:Uncharacterized protein n=1 Tax=Elysia crispata TaxID=231223 RepID=A0AAE1AHN2_9GAST|nr:hypothetical protein RRG08_031645 [Elysia crispata]